MSLARRAPRTLVTGIAVGVALLATIVAADQPTIARIGILVPLSKNSPTEEGLRNGLRELGYVEGKNMIIEWRRSAGGEDRSLAAELARTGPDVIVVASTAAARGALEASKSTPVVFLSGDPVGSGLVASLAKPGGNATGVSGVLTELTPKQLELLRAIAPRARHVACLMNASNPSSRQQFEAAKNAAPALGLQIMAFDVRNDGDLDAALHRLSRSGADSVLVTGDILFRANRSKIAQAVRKARLPGAFPYREYHDEGALMSYGPDLKEAGRKMAGYVDRILKGARPADLPIEQIAKYELVIDLRIAQELGLKVPQDVLLRADEVMR